MGPPASRGAHDPVMLRVLIDDGTILFCSGPAFIFSPWSVDVAEIGGVEEEQAEPSGMALPLTCGVFQFQV